MKHRLIPASRQVSASDVTNRRLIDPRGGGMECGGKEMTERWSRHVIKYMWSIHLDTKRFILNWEVLMKRDTRVRSHTHTHTHTHTHKHIRARTHIRIHTDTHLQTAQSSTYLRTSLKHIHAHSQSLLVQTRSRENIKITDSCEWKSWVADTEFCRQRRRHFTKTDIWVVGGQIWSWEENYAMHQPEILDIGSTHITDHINPWSMEIWSVVRVLFDL